MSFTKQDRAQSSRRPKPALCPQPSPAITCPGPKQNDSARCARDLVPRRCVTGGVILDAVELRRVDDVDVGLGDRLIVEKKLDVARVIAEARALRRGCLGDRLARA